MKKGEFVEMIKKLSEVKLWAKKKIKH
jgi:hypothetical protein